MNNQKKGQGTKYFIEKDEFMDDEDLDLIKELEAGNFVPVDNLEFVKKDHIRTAKNTLKKMNKEPIYIRIDKTDLVRLKEKASQEGLPYQTFIGSILHKYLKDDFTR